ncbi:DoxX family protein [Taklimakanibacter deserti]|uniref:DoxX family protein n=1 Tax=Taklimakanibacter deserti TaxID=2267839 RepID=UPI000E652759
MDTAARVGFLLMGGMFAYEGLAHLLDLKALTAFLAERDFPAPRLLVPVGSAVQITAGLALAFGIARPYAAWALIIFTIVASLMLLNFWRYSGPERNSLRSGFIVNIAVIGGLLTAAGAG